MAEYSQSQTCTGSNCVQGPNYAPLTVNPPVNSNKAVITYELNGFKRLTAPGLISSDDGENGTFQKMVSLSKDQKWAAVLSLAESEKTKAPEWLTPYYISGIANTNLCNITQATKDFQYFVEKSEGSLTYKAAFDETKSHLQRLKDGITQCPTK